MDLPVPQKCLSTNNIINETLYKVSQVSHVCYIRLLGGKLFRILILHPLPTQPHRIPSVTFRKIIGSSRPNNMHIYKWRWSIVQSFKSIQEASKC